MDDEKDDKDYEDTNLVEEAEKEFFLIINAAKQKREAEDAKKKQDEDKAPQDEKEDYKKVGEMYIQEVTHLGSSCIVKTDHC